MAVGVSDSLRSRHPATQSPTLLQCGSLRVGGPSGACLEGMGFWFSFSPLLKERQVLSVKHLLLEVGILYGS